MQIDILLGSIILVKDWKKGDMFQFNCPACGFHHAVQLNEENTEEVMLNLMVDCECGQGWQIIA